jgi:hypothetical protein
VKAESSNASALSTAGMECLAALVHSERRELVVTQHLVHICHHVDLNLVETGKRELDRRPLDLRFELIEAGRELGLAEHAEALVLNHHALGLRQVNFFRTPQQVNAVQVDIGVGQPIDPKVTASPRLFPSS